MIRIIFGGFLVIFGLGLFAEQFPILKLLGFNFNAITPIFWILIGVLLLIKHHNFWGTVLVLLGLLGFFSGLMNVSTWTLFFPVLVIAFGISILFRKNETYVGNSVGGATANDTINESIAFSGYEKRFTTKKFKGGKIDTVFAGMKLDLREVELAPEGAELEINAVFGGGEILVSPKMHVISKGTAVMGGWSNMYSGEATTGPALTITGAAVFGGVEIKN